MDFFIHLLSAADGSRRGFSPWVVRSGTDGDIKPGETCRTGWHWPSPSCPRRLRQSGVVVKQAPTRFAGVTTSAATMTNESIQHGFISGLCSIRTFTYRIQTGSRVWANTAIVGNRPNSTYRASWLVPDRLWRPTS